MRKLAGILALSLFLELLIPTRMIYAANSGADDGQVVYDVETGEREDIKATEVLVESQKTLGTGMVADEVATTDAEENSVSDMTTESGEVSPVNKVESIAEDEVSSTAVDVTNQAQMYIYENVYSFEDKGYPLSAAFVLPIELLDKNLIFTQIMLSIDDGVAKKQQAEDVYVYCYDWNEYGYCSFFAGYDNTISEGSHKLTYQVTYTIDGTEYYHMEFTDETQFHKDSETERIYYKVTGDEFYDYMPNKKGTEIARIVTSYIDYRSLSEKITNVQLRNHITGEMVHSALVDMIYDEYVYTEETSDSRYKGIYDERTELYVWPQIPSEYYYQWGRATIVLEEDIEEGMYDVVITTDAGYTHIYDSYYEATDAPVLYNVNTTQYTEDSDVLVYADNSGKYVSAFVYGLNLTEANIPVFYDDSYTTVLTEYDESDPYCHVEKHKYGMDVTVRKKNKSHVAWDLSNYQNKYKEAKVKVPNVEKFYRGAENENVEMPYYAEMVYREEYVKEGNFSITPGLRLYLGSEYVETGDTIIVEGDKYVSGVGTLELSEEYEVLFNGLEYYIHIPKKSELYSNVYNYEVINERTDEKEEVWIYEPYEEELQLSNIWVPANCTWEIHGARDVGNILYSGSTTEEKEVLSAEQITDLSKYGKLRVCIYDAQGNVIDRYITVLKCGEYYTVNYVLNDDKENPAAMSQKAGYYFKDKELILEIPERENYTFAGWYSDKRLTKKVSKIAKGSRGNKTLYAKWTPEVYSIRYDGNGGKGKVKTTTWKYKETAAVATNKFKRTGYIFTGWNTKKDGSGEGYNEARILSRISDAEKNQLTLYAIWEPITYTLVLDKNHVDAQNGTVNTSPLSVKMIYGEAITLNGEEYIQKGYTIKSWNTKANGKGKKYNIGDISNLTGNKDDIVMLYAQWGIEKYSITFDYKGGKVSAKNPSSYTYKSKDIVLKEPKRTGYIFDGYYECDPEAKEFSQNMKKVSVIKAGTTGNIKLYAKWIPITYKVMLNKNSEEATYGTIINEQDAIKECIYDEENPYVLTGKEYVREDKQIAAWATKPNGKGKKYKSTTELKNLTTKNGDSIVLYAQWETKKYTIKYEGMEGIKHKNPLSYTYDTNKKITLKNVSKKGYIFKGWYAGSVENEANRITAIDRSLKQDMIIYAKWTPITYTVCLKPNATDASVEPGMVQMFSVKYDEQFELKADTYTRKHYNIAYWGKNSKGSGTRYQNGKVSNLTTKEGSVITLYPKWEPEKYTIVYKNMSFANVKNSNPETYTYSKELKLKNPTRKGYSFGGWYLEDTTLSTFDPFKAAKITKISKGTEGPIAIYAYWKPRT